MAINHKEEQWVRLIDSGNKGERTRVEGVVRK